MVEVAWSLVLFYTPQTEVKLAISMLVEDSPNMEVGEVHEATDISTMDLVAFFHSFPYVYVV